MSFLRQQPCRAGNGGEARIFSRPLSSQGQITPKWGGKFQPFMAGASRRTAFDAVARTVGATAFVMRALVRRAHRIWSTGVQPMTSDSIRRRAFRRMLAREAGTGADAPAIAAAARRLCDRFAEQLSPLIGDAGVAAICARSLHLTERSVRGLASVRPAQGEASFALLQQSLEQQQPAAATEAAVAVLATASELLASFIGEGLTTSLLREAWPEDFAGDTTEETIT